MLRKFVIVFILIGVGSFFAFQQLDVPLVGIDDANIFFVYAKNLAHGNGIVFFPGSERVEGITSLLWLLTITPAFLLSNHPEAVVFAFSLTILSAGIAYFLDAVDSVSGNHKKIISAASAAVLIWCIASPTFLIWAVLSLMDVGLWCAVILFGSGLLMRVYAGDFNSGSAGRQPGIVVLIVAAILTRPEGIFLSGLIVLLLVLHGWAHTGSLIQSIRHNRMYEFSWIGSLAGITAFRLAYFGYPLPNTFYAKVSPSLVYNISEGWDYFFGFFRSSWLVGFSIVLAVIWAGTWIILAAWKKRTMPGLLNPFFPVFVVMLALLATPVLTGGDHFYYYRFYQPIWPLLALPFLPVGMLVTSRIDVKNRWLMKTSSLAVLAFGAAVVVFASPNWVNFSRAHRISWEFQVTELGRAWGQALNDVFASQKAIPSAGEIAVGGFQFAYQGKVIDLMGLNNVQMAHSAGDRRGIKNHAAFNRDVFFSQKPEVLLPRLYESGEFPADMSGCGSPLLREALKDLLCDQEFQNLYRPVQVPVHMNGEDRYLFFFLRRDAALPAGVTELAQ